MSNRNFAEEWAAQEDRTITLGGGHTVRLMADVDPLLLARYVDAQVDEEGKLSTQESVALLTEVLHGVVVPDDHADLDAALALKGSEFIGIARMIDVIEYAFEAISGRPFVSASSSSPTQETPDSTTPSTAASDTQPDSATAMQLLRSAQ